MTPPAQNRVTPLGELLAAPARGLVDENPAICGAFEEKVETAGIEPASTIA
jgi:hypothetical protein